MYEELTKKINQVMPILNEKQRGKSRNTIVAGMKENSIPQKSPAAGGKASRRSIPK